MTEEKTAEPRDIKKSIVAAKEVVLGSLAKAENFTLGGKKLSEWESYFKIKIPESPSNSEVIGLLAKTEGFISMVNFRLSVAKLTRDVCKREVDAQTSIKFTALKSDKTLGKVPTNEHVTNQIENDLFDDLNCLMIANYIVSFWEDRINSLISSRKVLEVILMGLMSEARRGNIPLPNSPGNWGSDT